MIRVQEDDFDIGAELERLTAEADGSGAVSCFVGLVRDFSGGEAVSAMTLEHYPGMTERQLGKIEAEARARWPLDAVLIVHRYGRLEPGDRIVLVATASAHRKAAIDACSFLIDWLKTKAPFWKLEETPDGGRWVDADPADTVAEEKWAGPPARPCMSQRRRSRRFTVRTGWSNASSPRLRPTARISSARRSRCSSSSTSCTGAAWRRPKSCPNSPESRGGRGFSMPGAGSADRRAISPIATAARSRRSTSRRNTSPRRSAWMRFAGWKSGSPSDRAASPIFPYADGGFDVVWCQNVSMNVADKARMFAEAHRVLAPGGRYAISHAALGPTGEPLYPLPWATDPSYSFPGTPEDFVGGLTAAGFRIVENRGEGAVGGKRGQRPRPGLGAGIALGENLRERLLNSIRSGEEGRLVGMLVVAERG